MKFVVAIYFKQQTKIYNILAQFFLMIFVSIKIMIQNNLLITIYTGTCTCINTCIISINDLERNYFLKQPVYFV